jgi:hypothetical protein
MLCQIAKRVLVFCVVCIIQDEKVENYDSDSDSDSDSVCVCACVCVTCVHGMWVGWCGLYEMIPFVS